MNCRASEKKKSDLSNFDPGMVVGTRQTGLRFFLEMQRCLDEERESSQENGQAGLNKQDGYGSSNFHGLLDSSLREHQRAFWQGSIYVMCFCSSFCVCT